MRLPKVDEVSAAVSALGEKLDGFLVALEAASPDYLKNEEEAIRQVIKAALQGTDVASLEADLARVLDVVKKFRGVVGDGVGPDLVP